MTDSLDTVADRVRALFERPTKDGRPVTAKAASAIARASGYPLSEATISELKSGQNSNPSRRTLDALCVVFDVDLSYFSGTVISPEARRAQLDHRYRQLAQRVGLQNVEYRLGSSDDATLRRLIEILEEDYVGSARADDDH